MKQYIKLFEQFTNEAEHIDKMYVEKDLDTYSTKFKGIDHLNSEELTPLVNSIILNIHEKDKPNAKLYSMKIEWLLYNTWNGEEFETNFDEIMNLLYNSQEDTSESKKHEYLIEDENGKRRIVYTNRELKVKNLVEDRDGKKRIISKVVKKSKERKEVE